MTEAQLPLFLAIAFVGGYFASFWPRKSFSQGLAILFVVAILNSIGWIVYGFIQNWEPAWGLRQVISGTLYAAPGLLIFSIFPALLGNVFCNFSKSIFQIK